MFRRTAGFGSLIAGIAAGTAQVFSPGTAWAQKVDLPAGVAKVLAERSPATVDDLRQIERQVARVVERVLPATVGLRIGNGMGSGVVVNREGLILTAGHVVGEAGQRATVIFPDGRRLPGYTLGADHDCDAGMVELLDPPADLVYCPLAEGDELAAGTWVVATGQPGGVVALRDPPVRLGRVLFTGHDVVCSDCEIVGGDSGGPLVNLAGEVVGIHSSIGPMINQNFHVSIGAYRRGWERMHKGESWGGPFDRNGDGIRDRPMLGVAGRTEEGTCLITQVFPGLPAERAGLKPGDVVTKVDGRTIDAFEALIAAVEAKMPGRRVLLEVRRREETLEFRPRLAVAPPKPADKEKGPQGLSPGRAN
ncbi:MAG: trypsin-like peptidase domain-containing protein [Pirellulales bacterium]|nr:trypsin-like peptidase domain-containing protein [Pirellulales bacterium]